MEIPFKTKTKDFKWGMTGFIAVVFKLVEVDTNEEKSTRKVAREGKDIAKEFDKFIYKTVKSVCKEEKSDMPEKNFAPNEFYEKMKENDKKKYKKLYDKLAEKYKKIKKAVDEHDYSRKNAIQIAFESLDPNPN